MERMEDNGCRILNRDVIKLTAMFTMLLNHIADSGLIPYAEGTYTLHFFFTGIGYFTAITMCCFLVEGYDHTRSKVKYGLRLLAFAFASQLPFSYALPFGSYNMLFTLFLCFMILVVREKIANTALKGILIFLLILATIPCDWPLLAPMFTLMFVNSRGNRMKMWLSYLIAFVLFTVITYMSNSMTYELTYPILVAALEGLPLLLSGIVIMYLYNGKRAEHGQSFYKWFFYLFYPLHLTVIGLLAHGVI